MKKVNTTPAAPQKVKQVADIGLRYGRYILYWRAHLSMANINARQIERIVQYSIEAVAILVGMTGLGSLLIWVMLESNFLRRLEILTFWQSTNQLLALFWVGLIAFLYVIYSFNMQNKKDTRRRIEPAWSMNNTETEWINLASAKLDKNKEKINIVKHLTPRARVSVERAMALAVKYRQPLGVQHLFLKLLEDFEVRAALGRLGVAKESLKNKVAQWRQAEQAPKKLLDNTQPMLVVVQLLLEAYIAASQFNNKKIGTLEIFLECVRYDDHINELLYNYEVDLKKIINVIRWFSISTQQVEQWRKYRRSSVFKPGKQMNRAYTSVATPLLNQLGRDLTIMAKRGQLPFCVARDVEIAEIFTALDSGNYGVLLNGPVGVGKYAIIVGIAQRMVAESVPKILRDKRLVEIDISRLISGASAAQAEGRLLAVVDEAARSGNIILVIRDVENMVGVSAGAEQSLDLSEVLAGAIDQRQIVCFATITNYNWQQYVEQSSLGKIMKKVDIEEPHDDQAVQIVGSKVGMIESQHQVYVTYDGLESAISLSSQYIHDKILPAKAIEVLEQAGAQQNKKENKVIDKAVVAAVISKLTKIPIERATGQESKKLLNLEAEIHQQLIDQEEAVSVVAASLRRARAQLRKETRPIANFLFLGPTGVGKTELAKTLARIYFGGEQYMVRVDMSEYQHPDSVKKLIGEPRGNKGYLTEAVRNQLFALLLLDEFEKAYSGILNLFLQVMEDGRLTDGQGQKIDFTNTIIIATSNAGAVFIQEQVRAGRPVEEIKQTLLNDHLQEVFRPELINRFDSTVVFKPLRQQDVEQITALMLGKLAENLERQGITLQTTKTGIKLLAKQGFDPQFGARPLRRLLQDTIENQVANLILAGELKRRDTVVIDNNAQVKVQKAKAL